MKSDKHTIHFIIRILIFSFFIFHLSITNIYSQNDTLSLLAPSKQFNFKRFTGVVVSEALLSSLSLVGLNNIWYSGYPRSSFHFFNDNNEWMQMDKAGHFMASYYLGRTGADLIRWSGVNEKKAIWFGGWLGTIYLTTVEIMDGFSSQWGASPGDLAANIFGSVMFTGQELLWKEQRIIIKYSFHPTEIAKYRPDLLGNNLAENILKDYNGQTYWFSFNPASFFSGRKENKESCNCIFNWVNIAVGYSAYGMTGARENPQTVNGENIQEFERYRQYYLSLDVDLSRIHTKSKFLKTCLGVFGFIKIPFPALEYNRVDGIVFHPFYF